MRHVVNMLMDKYLERGKRIAELEAQVFDDQKEFMCYASNEKRLKAKLDAVNKLPEKWRKYTFDNPEATSYIDSADCADELEATIKRVKALATKDMNDVVQMRHLVNALEEKGDE